MKAQHQWSKRTDDVSDDDEEDTGILDNYIQSGKKSPPAVDLEGAMAADSRLENVNPSKRQINSPSVELPFKNLSEQEEQRFASKSPFIDTTAAEMDHSNNSQYQYSRRYKWYLGGSVP